MRIVAMSGWILWVVAGIFENIGVVQEGMETISRPNQVLDRPDSKPLVVQRGEIRFDDVSFHYGRTSGAGCRPARRGHPRPLADDRGRARRSGWSAARAPASRRWSTCCCASTTWKSGRILIDGQDIAHVTQDSLRAQIGMVTQDTSLLHRSVRDNILYGRPDARRGRRLIAAAQQGAGRRVHRRPGGHEGAQWPTAAHVGERGVKLSGGQRQRIAIARVLLKDAPILILDEATSALDSEVEAAIQEQLYNLMEGKTVIAIAHRLSTIAAMDRLVVMDEGRIVEQGTHAELLQRGGLYAELWARQSGGFLAREAAE